MSAESVKLVILDVDGVLTDGGIYLDAQGQEFKRFNVYDGTGIKYLQRSGITIAIISGRYSEPTAIRAKQLDINIVHQKSLNKLETLQEILHKTGVREEEVAYIGDDLIDLPVLRRVGFPIAPANARPEVKQVAMLVTKAAGGSGAVREAAEHILRAQGRWAGLVERYLR
ncbi:MAG: HAD-IIIA family hydrolase [Planctomycetota bacterium]|nr:HAD-IIIA family hydrolase [Planctomycetota bacterium]